MDICLVKAENWTQIRPMSIHGILWLQTHFKSADWESLATDRVKIANSEAILLASDAATAGLSLNTVPAVVNSNQLS